MTTWTTCAKITRTDGVVVGITDLDIDITVGGTTYVSGAGYTPSSYTASADLAVNNADIEGVLSAAGVDRDDIRAGLYDRAAIVIYLVDYVALTVVKTLASGHWGEATLYRGRYVAEFRSLSQQLQEPVGEVVSPTCRAELGDARCQVSMGPLTQSVTITSVTSAKIFTDTARTEATNYWRGGVITFTSGDNNGYEMEIKSSTSGGQFTLFQPMPFTPAVSDTATVVPGCDKTFATCRDTYNNIVNFRGEPYVPGIRKILKFAGQ